MSPRGPCTCDEAMKPESGVSGMSSWACPQAGVNSRLRPRAQEQPPVWTSYSPVLLTNRHPRWAQNKIHRRQGHLAWGMTSVRAAAHWKEVWLPPCSESPCMLGGDPGVCLPFTPLRPHQTARRLKPHFCLEDSPDDSPGRGPRREKGRPMQSPSKNPRHRLGPWMWERWAPLPPHSSPSPNALLPRVEMVEIY